MPIIGAVAFLSPDPQLRAHALQALAADPDVELGPLGGPRQPLVLDTPDRSADKAASHRIRSIPGVLDIVVAYADLSDLLESK